MLKKILLTVAYDGSGYFGFQRQADENCPTIQGELEKSLSKFFKKDIECVGASRTDRGVHALGQRVAIEVETTVPTENIPFALCSFLPKDIAIMKAEDVSFAFHPRYDCISKEYQYKIYNAKCRNPLYRNFSEFCHNDLDIIAMNEGAKHLVGTHNFKAFAASAMTVKSTVRTIFEIDVEKKEDFVIITICGNGFLYNMVRIITGTLIMVGEGKMPPKRVEEILKNCDRTKAGKTAGPNGLTLMRIDY